MRHICWIWLLIVPLSACKQADNSSISVEDIKDSSLRKVAPISITNDVSFYDINQEMISTNRFNQLLAQGTYLSKATDNIDGSREIHLVARDMHIKSLEGSPMAKFTLEDLDGSIYNNENLKNKTIVLSFWNPASSFSQKDIKKLDALAKRYQSNEDIIWLASSTKSLSDVSNFLRNRRWHYRFAANQSKLTEDFGILAEPTHLIINTRGIIEHAIIQETDALKQISLFLETTLQRI